jgi:uncharacterized protein (TIGR02231 family)
MVTRTIPLEGAAGAREIVVGQLPEQVVPDSLFAEGNEGVEVRAVRFRARAAGEDPREEVRKLDASMEELGEKVQMNQRQREMLAKRAEYLNRMEEFGTATAKSDLARGVLDATALQKITLFSFEQREAVVKGMAELERSEKKLASQLNVLRRARDELTQGVAHRVREAVLFVEKRGEGKAAVRLNYLVGSCGWSPSYAFRAEKDGKNIQVECNALIHQMTGEDWKQVELTLSTASPSLSAAGMGLAPFSVRLTKDAGRKLSENELNAQAESFQGQQRAAVEQNRKATNLNDNIELSWMANRAANDLQTLELASSASAFNRNADLRLRETEGPSLSYPLTGSVSLASRNDQQMARILRTTFQSRFYHVASPVLSSYVYREAEMTNVCSSDLLAGPVTVYLDGRFVGHCEIPTVARGQTFVVGFGVDPQLRARRELVGRTEGAQGGNRELGFKYRLVLENYKSLPATVRLFDRLPYTDRPAEIRVKLGELRDALSKDDLYLRTEQPKGILRWDIEVPANATGSKVRMVEYGYSVEFDRSFSLNMPESGLPRAEPSKGGASVAVPQRVQTSPMDGRYQPPASVNQPMPAPRPAKPNASPADGDSRRDFEEMQRARLKR